MDVYKGIEETKKLIDSKVRNTCYIDTQNIERFRGFKELWLETNEWVDGYLSLVRLTSDTKALSICSSGDQAFSLVSKGVLNIDLIDLNELTKYYVLGLKRAMILKYSYEEFTHIYGLLLNGLTRDEITSFILDLTNFMDSDDKLFWEKVAEYYHSLNTRISLFHFISLTNNLHPFKEEITFLKNKECYDKCREILGSANFTFKPGNALDIRRKDTYDVILLSNILDYAHYTWGDNWKSRKINDYIKSLERITKDGGTIFLHYIFSGGLNSVFHPFNHSSATLKDLDGVIRESLDGRVYGNTVLLKRKK